MSYHQPFAEQLAFFRQKTNVPTRRWDDIRQEAHDRGLMVAGAQGADLLADLRGAVDKAISQGTGLAAFQKDFEAIVAKHGWTGWTGEGSKRGVAWRAKVIYQTNLASSYAAGRWQQLNDPDLVKVMPYWRYRHADGVIHPRPLHLAWDGLTLPRDHPFWHTHFPPNGWGCHCYVEAATRSEFLRAVAAGKGPANAPSGDNLDGIDQGFGYAPGRSVSPALADLLEAKLEKLPARIGADLAADTEQITRSGLVENFAQWVDRVLADGVARGRTTILGALTQTELAYLADNPRITPESADISVEDRLLVGRKAARHEQAGDALTAAEWKILPAALATPDLRSAYWDKQENRLLYVVPAPSDARSIRLVVHLGFLLGSPKRTLNLLRSAFKINAQALLDRTRYTLIR